MTNLSEVWTRLLGSTEADYSWADTIASSNEGFIYTAIVSNGNFNGNTNQGNADAHLIKYSTDGELIWSIELASDWYDSIFDIETDDNNNIYVAYRNNIGDTIKKFDENGNLIWDIIIHSNGINTQVNRIEISNDGFLYVGGNTTESLDGYAIKGGSDRESFIKDKFFGYFNYFWT